MAGVSHLHPAPESSRVVEFVSQCVRVHVSVGTQCAQTHTPKIKLCVFCDFIFITQPCSWVHLCILMSPRICIAEKYLRLHFLEAQLVRVDGEGAPGRMDASHPPLCFCCAVLKEMRPHNRRLSAGPLGEPHYRLREQEQVASRERHWS